MGKPGIEKEHYTLMAAICASLLSTPLMASGVNAVLPEIGASFNSSASSLGMVGTAYALGMAIFQLAAGRLGDIFGHRLVFLSGSCVFGLGNLLILLSPAISFFICSRLVQGIGAAMLNASGLALLASCAAPEKRPAYLGASGMAVYAGIACGPPAAGALAGALGWRWLFILNLFSCSIVWLLMKFTASHNLRTAPGGRFDWAGTLLFAAAMAGLTFFASQTGTSKAAGGIFFFLFLFFMWLFLRHEKRAALPLLNQELLRTNKILGLSTLAALISYASFFGLAFYFSFYLQTAKGYDVSEAGIILSIQALSQFLGTFPASRLCARWGTNKTSALGAGICGLGLLAAAFLSPASGIQLLVCAQCFLGAGISIFTLANTAMILESAGEENIGQASAITGAARNSGQLCSMSLITLSLGVFLGSSPIGPETLPGFMLSMKVTLTLFGLLNLAAIGCVFLRKE